jgi:hypothetical protein
VERRGRGEEVRYSMVGFKNEGMGMRGEEGVMGVGVGGRLRMWR